ncbi:hypothetical protein K492DRAFT_193366 [Lichtheimia hyalospora FSU 10163]|nr:hypothetical protein K492DRAFT_193366 [Lichtheimia hyalospora FSU 10163]
MLATFLLSPSFCCARRPTLSRRVWSSTSFCVTKGRKITTSSNATPSSTTTTTTSSSATSTTTTTTTTTSSTATTPVSLFWKRRSSHDGDNDTNQVERGMSNLLIQSTPAQRPGLLVRRPVSFKRAVRVTLTMVLDGRAILQCLTSGGGGDNTTMDDDDELVQTIQRMARLYQEHMQRITVVLTHLRRHDKALRVQIMHKTTLHLTLPDSLFFPHSPSKARACVWLQDLGIQPDTPGFELHEETYTSTCSKQANKDAAIIGPGYFKDIQLFLDQVDHLIERNMSFSNTSSSASRNSRIPTSS